MMRFNLARLLAAVLMLAASLPLAAQTDATAARLAGAMQAYPTSTTTVSELRDRLLALEEEVRETDSAATEERKRLSERMDAIEDADDGEANEAVRDQLAAHEERLDAIEENMPPRRLRLWMPPPALEE